MSRIILAELRGASPLVFSFLALDDLSKPL
jgi:hypothetical protein